jgi:hypothetical protein
MQVKKKNNLIISFIPAFQLSNLSGTDFLFRDLLDYLMENESYYELENAGEQFLQCANINPMVKILAGFLSSSRKSGARILDEQQYALYYSSRFASRDIMACLENFTAGKGSLSKSIRSINYEDGKRRGSKIKTINTSSNSSNALNPFNPIENIIKKIDSISGYDFMVYNYKKNSGMNDRQTVEELNPDSKYLFIIGSAPPFFKDLFDYLGSWNLKIAYFEYPDILIKSADASLFIPDLVLNITSRLNNILKVSGFLRKANPKLKIGFIHTFPKFSHYEIEDHFFYKNINERYLSLEYAGGEKLSERDKIRLESFIKIIK